MVVLVIVVVVVVQVDFCSMWRALYKGVVVMWAGRSQ
jgi:hypothetical protein